MILRQIFRSLNIQFVFYFLIFSYLPLLFFSIFGYYLNKDLIKKINESYLQKEFILTKIHLADYFKIRDNLVKAVMIDLINSSAEKTFASESPFFNYLKELHIKSMFIFKKDDLYYRYDGADPARLPIFKSLPDTTNFFIDELSDQFFIRKRIGQDFTILYSYAIKEIQNLLKSDPDTKYFLRTSKGKLLISADRIEKSLEIHGLDHVLSEERADFLNFRTEDTLKDHLILISQKSSAGLFSELNIFLSEIIIANIFLGFIMLFVAIILSKRITTPIRSLVSAVNKISKGDLTQPINIQSQDEIKVLADEFELMRQKLLESYTTLESKIDERTRALQEAQFQISHQEKMASLGLLAAGVAHEIGNPLTSISSMAQIIKRKIKDQNFIEYLNTILNNIERIRKIVRELVDFARPASYEATDTSINEIIRSAVGIVKYDRRAKSVNIELELDNNLPAVYLIADQLLQVFINILINAVDALTEERNRIIVRSFKQSSHIVIQFEDTGIGIEEKNLNKIFEPFFTTKQVGKGTGLGLSVSYGIIKNLNGKIDVKSTVGVGSIFTITIPRITRSQ